MKIEAARKGREDYMEESAEWSWQKLWNFFVFYERAESNNVIHVHQL